MATDLETTGQINSLKSSHLLLISLRESCLYRVLHQSLLYQPCKYWAQETASRDKNLLLRSRTLICTTPKISLPCFRALKTLWKLLKTSAHRCQQDFSLLSKTPQASSLLCLLPLPIEVWCLVFKWAVLDLPSQWRASTFLNWKMPTARRSLEPTKRKRLNLRNYATSCTATRLRCSRPSRASTCWLKRMPSWKTNSVTLRSNSKWSKCENTRDRVKTKPWSKHCRWK